MKDVEDQEKGILKPLTTNRLTQQMYSQAKLERDEEAV